MARRKKQIFGIFDRRPLIWFHYVLLTGIVLLTLYIIPLTSTIPAFDSVENFAVYFLIFFLVISISDQIIHKILGVD